jgi:hypothetical protein
LSLARFRRVKLYVKDVSSEGARFIRARRKDSVRELKARLGLGANQRLIFGTQHLNDEFKLSKYAIADGTVLEVWPAEENRAVAPRTPPTLRTLLPAEPRFLDAQVRVKLLPEKCDSTPRTNTTSRATDRSFQPSSSLVSQLHLHTHEDKGSAQSAYTPPAPREAPQSLLGSSSTPELPLLEGAALSFLDDGSEECDSLLETSLLSAQDDESAVQNE